MKKTKEERQSTLHLLLLSVLGVFFCTMSLAGMSFAWFTASVAAPAQTFSAASFSVAADVSGGAAEVKTDNQGVITLSFEKAGTYEVTLTAEGTGAGYCEIALDGGKKITGNLRGMDKDTFSFEVTLETDALITCTVTPWWRPYDGAGDRAESGIAFICAKASVPPQEPLSSGDETKVGPEGEKPSAEPAATTPAVTEPAPETTKPSSEPAPATPATSAAAEEPAPATPVTSTAAEEPTAADHD